MIMKSLTIFCRMGKKEISIAETEMPGLMACRDLYGINSLLMVLG